MKADEIGLPTFEASVSCGQWCQGGIVNMQPTTYAEYTDADEVWVKGEDAAKLAAENAALRQRNEELRTANEWVELESRLAEADAHLASLQNRYAQVTAENVAMGERLAEAEALLREMLPDRSMWHHIESGSWRARAADFLEADSAPAAHFWIPCRIEGCWPYWQCATPNGPYNFQAISLDEAEALCARERAAHEASEEGEK